MPDILDDLKNFRPLGDSGYRRAAAEIERLRNLVSDLVDLAEELPVNYPSQITKRKILRGQAEMFNAYQQQPRMEE